MGQQQEAQPENSQPENSNQTTQSEDKAEGKKEK